VHAAIRRAIIPLAEWKFFHMKPDRLLTVGGNRQIPKHSSAVVAQHCRPTAEPNAFIECELAVSEWIEMRCNIDQSLARGNNTFQDGMARIHVQHGGVKPCLPSAIEESNQITQAMVLHPVVNKQFIRIDMQGPSTHGETTG
jgi:hypothetical protein